MTILSLIIDSVDMTGQLGHLSILHCDRTDGVVGRDNSFCRFLLWLNTALQAESSVLLVHIHWSIDTDTPRMGMRRQWPRSRQDRETLAS